MIPEITITISIAQGEVKIQEGQAVVSAASEQIPPPPDLENDTIRFDPPGEAHGENEEAFFLPPPEDTHYETTGNGSYEIPPPPEVLEETGELDISEVPDPPSAE